MKFSPLLNCFACVCGCCVSVYSNVWAHERVPVCRCVCGRLVFMWVPGSGYINSGPHSSRIKALSTDPSPYSLTNFPFQQPHGFLSFSKLGLELFGNQAISLTICVELLPNTR